MKENLEKTGNGNGSLKLLSMTTGVPACDTCKHSLEAGHVIVRAEAKQPRDKHGSWIPYWKSLRERFWNRECRTQSSSEIIGKDASVGVSETQ